MNADRFTAHVQSAAADVVDEPGSAAELTAICNWIRRHYGAAEAAEFRRLARERAKLPNAQPNGVRLVKQCFHTLRDGYTLFAF